MCYYALPAIIPVCWGESHTYLPKSKQQILLEKLTDSQLSKQLSSIYGTRRFINAFTSARHMSLS